MRSGWLWARARPPGSNTPRSKSVGSPARALSNSAASARSSRTAAAGSTASGWLVARLASRAACCATACARSAEAFTVVRMVRAVCTVMPTSDTSRASATIEADSEARRLKGSRVSFTWAPRWRSA